MKDFRPSPMNHGKGNVAGQLVPVEYNRLTISEVVSIDEPAGGYMEMLENRNSARGYVMALEDKSAMEGYLETMLQGTILKQNAYRTLASSEIQAETMEQLVSLPWKAVVLRYFEEYSEDCAKNTRSRGSTLRKNRVTTEVCLVHDGTDSRRI